MASLRKRKSEILANISAKSDQKRMETLRKKIEK
jgi:hypothetical protein